MVKKAHKIGAATIHGEHNRHAKHRAAVAHCKNKIGEEKDCRSDENCNADQIQPGEIGAALFNLPLDEQNHKEDYEKEEQKKHSFTPQKFLNSIPQTDRNEKKNLLRHRNGRIDGNPYEVTVTSYVDRNITRLTNVGYTQRIVGMALTALRKSATELIYAGDGEASPVMFGFQNATNTKGEAMYQTIGAVNQHYPRCGVGYRNRHPRTGAQRYRRRRHHRRRNRWIGTDRHGHPPSGSS